MVCPSDCGMCNSCHHSVRICYLDLALAQLTEALLQATSRKVASSIPGGITRIFFWRNPGVDSASNSNEYLGVKAAGA